MALRHTNIEHWRYSETPRIILDADHLEKNAAICASALVSFGVMQ